MRSRIAWLTACSVFALAGCGGDEERASAPTIDPAAATQLAELSDDIARLIDEGDTCTAAHRADELRARAEEAIAGGHVPPALAGELEENADALVNEVNCASPPPPEESSPPPEDDDEDRKKDKKKDKDRDE